MFSPGEEMFSPRLNGVEVLKVVYKWCWTEFWQSSRLVWLYLQGLFFCLMES